MCVVLCETSLAMLCSGVYAMLCYVVRPFRSVTSLSCLLTAFDLSTVRFGSIVLQQLCFAPITFSVLLVLIQRLLAIFGISVFRTHSVHFRNFVL